MTFSNINFCYGTLYFAPTLASKSILKLAPVTRAYLGRPRKQNKRFCTTMIIPSDSNKSIKIDREAYESSWTVYALRVPPRLCHSVRKAFKSHLLELPRTQVVIKPGPSEPQSLLLVSRYLAQKPTTTSLATSGNLDDVHVGNSDEVSRAFASCASVAQENVRHFVAGISAQDFTTWVVRQNYGNCSIEHVLRTLLPADVPVPTSFETVGHIAHVNLRDEHKPWKLLIGEVMLDKLAPRVRTVVNKTESTGGPYRTFSMEVLAGDSDLVTSVKENGCTFLLDFENVYWNSRLETEHRRIVNSIKDGEVLLDAFCGVGPFAIPAAKRGRCTKVYANDLNPSSVKYLEQNVKKNGILTSLIETSCSCARRYIQDAAKRNVRFTRVVMNFPSGAPEFLDVFRGLYQNCDVNKPPMPTIHCYCFVKGDNEFGSARLRVRQALFGQENKGVRELPDSSIDVRLVRDVAPRKVQVCVTFKLPEEVAFCNMDDQPDLKRAKLDV